MAAHRTRRMPYLWRMPVSQSLLHESNRGSRIGIHAVLLQNRAMGAMAQDPKVTIVVNGSRGVVQVLIEGREPLLIWNKQVCTQFIIDLIDAQRRAWPHDSF